MRWVIPGLIAVIAIYLFVTYNALIRKKSYIDEAWAQIDVQLKRKANVLANMMDAVKMLSDFEGKTLTRLTELRAMLQSGNRDDALQANGQVAPLLKAIHESYPQLTSNQAYLKLMSEISDSESKIAYARTRFNQVVTVYNAALLQIPTVFFARMLNFQKEKTYELDPVEREYADNMRIGEL